MQATFAARMQRPLRIALVGNPNSGKSSLFNALTGLNQKVGNFPGVTVDKKTGSTRLSDALSAEVIDLPGTYSLYAKSADEKVTCDVLLNPDSTLRPHITVVIADAANLKRNLLFCSQIMDLGTPIIIALTMLDIARRKGIAIDVAELERQMGVPVVAINPRKNKGIAQLKKAIADRYVLNIPAPAAFIPIEQVAGNWIADVHTISGVDTLYSAMHVACSFMELGWLNAAQRMQIAAAADGAAFNKTRAQAEEIVQRYARIAQIMQSCVVEDNGMRRTMASERIDKILLHPVWGNAILLVVLFLLFQSIFWLAENPMSWVEQAFAWISSRVSYIMPDGRIEDLVVNGLIAGIGGIAIFIPQIMILFGCITILEDTGYMARISFLTDRLMRSAGLNGRSVMPLISGMACAVPAVMAARTIQNTKERLITIMVTPLMSCSARLPVYTVLIALVVPEQRFLGIFGLKGLVLMGLYLLGFFMSLIVSRVMSMFIKLKERTYFLMELPVYRTPRWGNVLTTMLEKAKIFVRDAGKVILVISLILWAMASYGPPGAMDKVDAQYAAAKAATPNDVTLDAAHSTARLEASFAGRAGHALEPVIRPLGYDWKIGIALITSFAAREVFVGTMATLYSVGTDDEAAQEATLREKMRAARRADGRPVYDIATGVSLLLFYVFALQCMSTLAIVKRETRSWKWPAIQFAYMFVLAWGSAWIAYQLLK